jgi:hypothetical protein
MVSLILRLGARLVSALAVVFVLHPSSAYRRFPRAASNATIYYFVDGVKYRLFSI